ncbi:hypothetical protein FRX31_009511 [Thalictrum thalictroides]|uniref:Uncharacterized protein n=1 Tax=Thalictrum thalictroides TaxID=46969 RepID=A0A7J6WWG0_THATH|nr:hypothetical protein FRX31_009511 [Thalictrum thalictroides]
MAHHVSILLFFIIFVAGLSTFNAQVKQCEYVMVVNTGPTRGPTYKLSAIIEAIGGSNINTTDIVKKWGAMGKGYTYFLPYSQDRFVYNAPCLPANFCNIGITGKKGELKPHWYINNITVATTGEGINRLKTFRFLSGNEIEYTYPRIDDGECP